MLEYCWKILYRAFFSSLHGIGQSGGQLIFYGVFLIVQLIFFWFRKGKKAMRHRFTKMIIPSFLMFIIAWFPIFIYHLAHTSYIMWEEQSKSAEKAVKERDNLLSSLKNKSKQTLPAVAANSSPLTPNLASIRIASQKQIPSTDDKLPYGREVILQTDTVIEPVAFVIEFSGEIGKGNAGFISGSRYDKSNAWIMNENHNMFIFKWESPAFTPEKPIRIIVFSKNYITAIKFLGIPYTWP